MDLLIVAPLFVVMTLPGNYVWIVPMRSDLQPSHVITFLAGCTFPIIGFLPLSGRGLL